MEKRIKAFATHLGLSIVVGLLSALMVFFVWCPSPLDTAIGVRDIFLLMLLVDVILGPIVTLITYKPTADFLKMDLPLIILCQTLMMSYGMYAVFQGRPAFIVYGNGAFNVIRNVDIEPKSREKARQDNNALAQADWLHPRWVSTTPARDFFSESMNLMSVDTYRPLESANARILNESQPLAKLKLLYKNQPDSAKLEGLDEAQIKWLALKGTAQDKVVLIDAHSAAVLKIVYIPP